MSKMCERALKDSVIKFPGTVRLSLNLTFSHVSVAIADCGFLQKTSKLCASTQLIQWHSILVMSNIQYSPVTTSHTRDLSRVVPRVIQREEKICHA